TLDVIDHYSVEHTDAAERAEALHTEQVLREVVLEVAVLQPDGPTGVVRRRGAGLLEDVRRHADRAAITHGHPEIEIHSADVELVGCDATRRCLCGVV